MEGSRALACKSQNRNRMPEMCTEGNRPCGGHLFENCASYAYLDYTFQALKAIVIGRATKGGEMLPWMLGYRFSP